MHSIVLYSQEKASFDHTAVHIDTGTKIETIFVRAEVFANSGPEEALLMAEPREGETVLNAIPVPA